MTMIRALVTATLTLLLGASPLLAQQSTSQDGAAETQPGAQTAPEKPATAASGDKSDSPSPAQRDAAGTSPFDYRSSEEISEDLSVSFPVDI